MRNDDLRSAYSERFLPRLIPARQVSVDDSCNPRGCPHPPKSAKANMRLHKKIKKRTGSPKLPADLQNTKRNRILSAIAFNGSIAMSDTRNSRGNFDPERESEMWEKDDNASNVGLVSNAAEWEKLSCLASTYSIDDLQSRIMKMRLGSRHN